MRIPEHWAEARVEGKVNGRQRVIRRFGWSDTGADEARANAERRAHDALRELQAGKQVAQREQKLPYGGSGLPIREQILARNGDVVITRNSYGAHCLNVPDVLFADVDHEPRLPAWAERLFALAIRGIGAVAFAAVIALAWWGHGKLACAGVLLGFAAPVALLVAMVALRRRPTTAAASRARAIAHIRAVANDEEGMRIALYETPLGWRLLALHRPFDPAGADARTLLRTFGSDPAYVQMCELQACFRARTSGKPWRMNVRHIRPRPGVWPVHPDRVALRQAWIAEYEAAAVHFAACRFLEELGDGRVDPRCAEVQRIHDELSRARSDLPLA